MSKATQALQNARTRTWQEEAHMLLSLLDCIILDQEAVYASSEFTTGRRFYELCRQYDVRSREQLKKRLGEEEYQRQLLLPNKEEGIRFARKVRQYGHNLVLTPNPFHAAPLNLDQNWTQDEYLEFWNMVIRRKCHAIYFNEAWEFSNGCTFEYLAGVKEGVQLFDHHGESLKLAAAIEMIATAIESLESDGFSLPKLREALAELRSFSS